MGFKNGDYAIGKSGAIKDHIVLVADYRNNDDIGVEVLSDRFSGHNLNGKLEKDKGWYVGLLALMPYPKIKTKKGFNIGDRVKSKIRFANNGNNGSIGTIVNFKHDSNALDILIRFDDDIGGHNGRICKGDSQVLFSSECNRCWWFNEIDFELIADGEKTPEKHKFNVGNVVNVINREYCYNTYKEWLKRYAPELTPYFTVGRVPPKDSIVEYVVKAVGKHENFDDTICAIENYDGDVYLMSEKALILAKREFKVGDRVRAIKPCDYNEEVVGKFGTIRKVKEDDELTIGVEFDEKFRFGHDLEGLCEDGYGRWCEPESLKLIRLEEVPLEPEAFEDIVDVTEDIKKVPVRFVYVARDKDGKLFAYTELPKVDIGGKQFYGKVFKVLDKRLFSDIEPMSEPRKIR